VIAESPYKILRIKEDETRDKVDEAWLRLVTDYHPGRPVEDLDEYQKVMKAYLEITDQTADYITVDGVCDWAPVHIRNEMWRAEDIREGKDIQAGSIDVMREWITALPDYMPNERLEKLPGFDVRSIIDRLLIQPEFKDAGLPEDPRAFRILWRNSKWVSKGAVVFGSLSTVSKKDRNLWKEGYVPLWTMTLSLPAWPSREEWEKERLVHHEMGHADFDVDAAKAKTKGHDMEENLATIARYGARDKGHACVIAHANAHPRTIELIQAAGWADGQGLLFKPLKRDERGAERAMMGSATILTGSKSVTLTSKQLDMVDQAISARHL